MGTIKFKRGLEANRTGITPEEGELIYTTDTKKVFIGDGSTAGGNPVNSSAAEVLTKLLTVDGTGSGLEAETVDGLADTQLIRNDQDGTIDGTLTVDDVLLASLALTPNSNSIVDVFIYDTSKDSDGGAWRKRTQHLSWYNETLNTATRGATKEFPAVAIIVVEAGTVTIYDATDPSMPMWMVFENSGTTFNSKMLGRSAVAQKSAVMCNAILSTAGNAGSAFHDSYVEIDFLKDIGIYRSTTLTRKFTVNISNRNNAGGTFVELDTGFIISATGNDLAVTVLPNAPIDTDTQLPIPTIAVATDSGVSIIHNNGNVVDLSHTINVNNESGNVQFYKNGIRWTSRNSGGYVYVQVLNELPNLDVTTAPDHYYSYANQGVGHDIDLVFDPAGGALTRALAHNTIGTFNGLTLLEDDTTDDIINDSRVNYITTDYQSGWLAGDIKGAFLSSTDTSNLTNAGGLDNDRSVNDNGAAVIGTITRTIVEPGAELVGYSGFDASNYMEQAYNSDLDFGTGDFYVMGWIDVSGLAGIGNTLMDRAIPSNNTNRFVFYVQGDGTPQLYTIDSGPGISFTGTIFGDLHDRDGWVFLCARRYSSGAISITVDHLTETSPELGVANVTNASAVTKIGVNLVNSGNVGANFSLIRVGAGTPTTEQLTEIYESERHLFKPNAACTLTSLSNDIRALDYDKDTNLLRVAGTTNLDTFNGLVRVDSEAGAFTSLSAANTIAAKGN